MRLLSTILFAFSLFFGTANAQHYTMTLPEDVDPEWSLCVFDIMSYSHNQYAAHGLATMEEEFAGVKTLTSTNGYTVTWNPNPAGGGEITVDSNNYKNQFWITLGFCFWTEDKSEKFYKEISGNLIGGSIDEEDLEGPYDGLCTVFVELCGELMDFGEAEQLQVEIDRMLPLESYSVFRGFDTYERQKRVWLWLDLANFEISHRKIADQIYDLVISKHPETEIFYGNRMLIIGDCIHGRKLWYRVLETENAEAWGKTYTGNRIFAVPRKDGNIMVSYTAALNNALLNIFGVSVSDLPKNITIGAVPESGDPNYWLSNFLTITRAEGMEVTDIVRSISGNLTLLYGIYDKALDSFTFSGNFEIRGIDQLGRRRTVIGGFNNLPFPK